MHKVSIDRDTFAKNKASNHYMLTARKLKIEPTQFEKDQFEYNPKVIYPVTFWNLSPSIRSQIGGPDGFYFGDARLSLNAETLFRKNLSLRTNLSYGFFDTFDEKSIQSKNGITISIRLRM